MKRLYWVGMILACLTMLGQMASAQGSYKLRVGDVLSIEVLQDPSLNRSTEVLPDGSFSFPFAGALPAAGRTLSDVQSSIQAAIAGNFNAPPDVFVSVAPKEVQKRSGTRAPRRIDVYMLGEVANPGLTELKPRTTLLQAIAVAGGVSRFAATKRIQLRRTDSAGRETVTQINYKALQDGAALSQDIELRDGDVILVPERRLFE